MRGSGALVWQRFHRRESERIEEKCKSPSQVKPHQVEIPEPEKEEPERILYAHAPVAVENIIPEPKVQVQESLNRDRGRTSSQEKKKPELAVTVKEKERRSSGSGKRGEIPESQAVEGRSVS